MPIMGTFGSASVTPFGGKPLLRLYDGNVINYTLGAGGLGGVGGAAAGRGGTTTATMVNVTLSATGGYQGVLNSTVPSTGGTGSVSVQGGLTFNGGSGGAATGDRGGAGGGGLNGANAANSTGAAGTNGATMITTGITDLVSTLTTLVYNLTGVGLGNAGGGLLTGNINHGGNATGFGAGGGGAGDWGGKGGNGNLGGGGGGASGYLATLNGGNGGAGCLVLELISNDTISTSILTSGNSFTIPANTTSVKLWVIGGGGGGGGCPSGMTDVCAGGGGAGGIAFFHWN